MTRSGWIVVAGACLTGGAAAVLYFFDPATVSIFPPCPFYAVTGFHCAGCGSLRAFHALLHGDGLAALGFNPLTTLSMPLLLAGLTREVRRLSGIARPNPVPAPAWSIWLVLGLLVTFGVLRNLPGFGFLAPG